MVIADRQASLGRREMLEKSQANGNGIRENGHANGLVNGNSH
jgi:hypothetical protein